jgi:hypothetical protein
VKRSRHDHDPSLAEAEDAQARKQLAIDRRDFLAALDRVAPQILETLKRMPCRDTSDLEPIRAYVNRWVQQRPALASMGWFVSLVQEQVRHEDRQRWIRPAKPHVSLMTPPPMPEEWLLRKLAWDPFRETESDYRARAQREIDNHVLRVKGWLDANGYPEPPARRNRHVESDCNVSPEKRWDVLVKKAVLEQTWEEIRDSFHHRGGGPEDSSLRELVKRQARRIQMKLGSALGSRSRETPATILDPYGGGG